MRIFDFLSDIEFKGDKNSIIIKWIIAIAVLIITVIWGYLNFRNNIINRLDNIEALTEKNIKKNESLNYKLDDKFDYLEKRINILYDDGIDAFQRYQQYNNLQLELIVDYGETNKEMLKEMLEFKSNAVENDIKNSVEKSKKYNGDEISLILPKFGKFREVDTDNIIYTVRGAPEDYINSIDTTKYRIVLKKKSVRYKDLYDFEYVKLNK